MTPKETANELIFSFSKIIDGNSLQEQDRLCKQCVILYCKGMQEERQRAFKIASRFYEKAHQSYEEKRLAGSEVAFVKQEVAEECRYIANAIRGNNALSDALKQKDYWGQVIDEVNKL